MPKQKRGPLTPCREPRCEELLDVNEFISSRSYCLEHARERRAGERTTHAAFYNSRPWRAARRLCLRLAGYACQDCKEEGVDRLATEADHVVPIEDGGALYDQENLRALCKPHHSRKTMREMKRRGAR